MQRDTFITALLSAAAYLKQPFEAVATQSLKDAYHAAKSWLGRKLDDGSDGAKALDLALEKPDSAVRKALLVEATADAGLEQDDEMRRLGQALVALLPAPRQQKICVSGWGNHVQVAGRDLVTTTRNVHRAIITPGEGHLTLEQRRKILVLIAQVADRLAGEDGRPRFGAVHAMLHRRFGVASYLTIPTERFAEVVSFLQRQRAIYRVRLRRRNPVAYGLDFLRAIHARRLALGWLNPQVYAFATEKLSLRRPILSLTALGPLQLNRLAELMRREVTKRAAIDHSRPADAAKL